MKYKQFLLTALSSTLATLPATTLAVGFGGGNFNIVGVAGGDLITAIQNIVNWLLMIVALIAVIYLIIGGAKYIISSGDEDAAGEAKNTILFALIGLVVIGISVVAVNFVLNAINNAAVPL